MFCCAQNKVRVLRNYLRQSFGFRVQFTDRHCSTCEARLKCFVCSEAPATEYEISGKRLSHEPHEVRHTTPCKWDSCI